MRRTITLLSVIALLVGMLATMAIADDFEPDPDEVDIDLDGPLTAEVTIILVATDDPPGKGCNLSDNPQHAHFVNADVTSSDTAVATVSPPSLNFQGCGDDHANVITITAVGCGEATVTVEAEEPWRAQGGPNAVFNEATILVTITGEGCPDDGPPGNGEFCAEPAAPAWANAILQANDFRPKGKDARVYGELISSVAQHMEQGATFDGFAKHEAGYAEAVWDFLKADGRAGPLPDGPAQAARPGWECEELTV